jgi:hypothetical protein
VGRRRKNKKWFEKAGTHALHRLPLPSGPMRQSGVESVPQCWQRFQ